MKNTNLWLRLILAYIVLIPGYLIVGVVLLLKVLVYALGKVATLVSTDYWILLKARDQAEFME